MKDSNSDGLEELLFNMASNAAEWGQRNPDMDVNVERMFSREIAKDYVEQLTAYINEVVQEVIGEDKNLSVASRGKELDDKFFNSPYVLREAAKNDLRAEQRTKAKKLMGEGW